ncbi:riboflavin synthase [Persicirhabdus sediminis]|uniref:Riboflavin synthase n=1 Tax=Persicirhabdus sediminis TaxID=454144 RepID=A0A8J7MGR4_9BACT|nr:riboflavin synthase [Persicirhabdus sediminis]MBK1792592.1 riboflavin synthase [Persicirhabdus sediminis]
MFTGLVEAKGNVISLIEKGESARLTIAIPFANELELGDSVAINGCCLTATLIENGHVSFDVLSQTLRVTSLGDLQAGSVVNLERALRVGDRLGGHFVLGHVDTVGEIISFTEHGQDHRLEIAVPQDIQRLCIDKGSLAIDGISLTIAELLDDSVVFWIIPHTAAETNLCQAAAGKRVNLEADMLAKHAARLLEH